MNEATYDDLVGVVSLLGALTREELGTTLDELALKQGRETGDDALLDAISDAVDTYYLVPYEDDETNAEFLTAGPMALPTLPDRAEDLPYVLNCLTCEVLRDELATQIESRLRAAATGAVQMGGTDEIEHLLGVTYNLKARADTGMGLIRERLDVVLSVEGQV